VRARGPDCGLMDVTRIIHYQGGYQEVLALWRLLEEEGVQVDSENWELVRALWVQEARELQRRRDQEWQELSKRHHRERGELGERQPSQDQDQEQWRLEWRELLERHGREFDELSQRHYQEVLEDAEHTPEGVLGSSYSTTSVMAAAVSDLNQVVISLVSTGTAAAIAKAVKRHRDRAPDSKVEVRDVTPGSLLRRWRSRRRADDDVPSS
jgi:hypothetical protein